MDKILSNALRVDNVAPEAVPPTRQPVTELVTPEQRIALVMHLCDSAIDPPNSLTFFDTDCVELARFIEEAEKLTPSAKLALAISLLSEVMMDVMLLEQQSTQSVLRALVLKSGGR